MQKKIYWSWAFKQIQMLGVMFGWGVNFFLEKVQFSSCHLNSRTPVHTLLHIWKKICAHLAKDLLGILQFAFMPRRADNDAGPRVFGGNLWLQGRNTGLLQKQLLQSQKQIYCFQVYFHPQDWQDNMWGLIPRWSRGLSTISVEDWEMHHWAALCLKYFWLQKLPKYWIRVKACAFTKSLESLSSINAVLGDNDE